jgi:sulfoxide reductase heme-binding subunit YedZ
MAGVIHYYWLVKSDVRKPLLYAGMVAVLLAYRLGSWLYGRGKQVAAGNVPHEGIVTAKTI